MITQADFEKSYRNFVEVCQLIHDGKGDTETYSKLACRSAEWRMMKAYSKKHPEIIPDWFKDEKETSQRESHDKHNS